MRILDDNHVIDGSEYLRTVELPQGGLQHWQVADLILKWTSVKYVYGSWCVGKTIKEVNKYGEYEFAVDVPEKHINKDITEAMEATAEQAWNECTCVECGEKGSYQCEDCGAVYCESCYDRLEGMCDCKRYENIKFF